MIIAYWYQIISQVPNSSMDWLHLFIKFVWRTKLYQACVSFGFYFYINVFYLLLTEQFYEDCKLIGFMKIDFQVKDALVQFETALSLDPNPVEAQAALYNKACCHVYRLEVSFFFFSFSFFHSLDFSVLFPRSLRELFHYQSFLLF